MRPALASGLKIMETDYYSPDFATAQRRFREAANAAGAEWESLPLAARGPDGEPLAIDVAWLGTRQPRRILLHTTGLHGIEGFAGSAVQLCLLAHRPKPPDDAALVFMHVLNPYGMAWLRRFNENNVDLNRNFLAPGESFTGVADAYRVLNGLLNPPTPPRSRDLFLLRAGAYVARYGFARLKQAIAEGQYEYPQGLFFGGKQGEPTAEAVIAWSRRWLAGAERVFVIDVHTGLGPWGQDSLLTHYPPGSERVERLSQRWGRRVHAWSPSGVAYKIRGGFLETLERELAPADVTTICQEFGAYRPLQTLYALREENRLHHWGNARQLDHSAKRRLLEVFCPCDPNWRRQIVQRGEALFQDVLMDLL